MKRRAVFLLTLLAFIAVISGCKWFDLPLAQKAIHKASKKLAPNRACYRYLPCNPGYTCVKGWCATPKTLKVYQELMRRRKRKHRKQKALPKKPMKVRRRKK